MELILLTGGTGHVGFRVLVEALSRGYKVRAAVRSNEKAEAIRSASSIAPYLSQLSFVIVPDIEKDGAFDEAVKNIDAIIHVASPLSWNASGDLDRDIIQPAIRGTLSILYSALKQPSIQRVVITSSLAAVSPSTPTTFTADNINPDPTGPYEDPFTAYRAAKTLALSRTRTFIAQEQPHFTIVNVMPSFVIGKNELATTPDAVASGSNRRALAPLLGVNTPQPMGAHFCHVDDVAYVHVAALNPELEGNRSFGVSLDYTQRLQWNDAIPIVEKAFPSAVERGIFPLGGSSATSEGASFDAGETERTLGITFRSYEDMITNIAEWYVEVWDRTRGRE